MHAGESPIGQPKENPINRWGWTASQRCILITVLLILAAYLGLRLRHDQQFVPDPLPVQGPRAGELQWRIDLNTADASTLSAIPRLGEVKAKAIVDYRVAFEKTHPGRPTFDHLEDVLHVKGVGAGTVATLKPYVTIESSTSPSSRP